MKAFGQCWDTHINFHIVSVLQENSSSIQYVVYLFLDFLCFVSFCINPFTTSHKRKKYWE